MKKKTWRIIIGVVVLLMISGGLYAYKEFTRKVKDLTHVKAGMTIDADKLITAFETNETDGNSKYLDQIIAVKDEDAYATARQLARIEGIFGGTTSGANVWAAMQRAKAIGPRSAQIK